MEDKASAFSHFVIGLIFAIQPWLTDVRLINRRCWIVWSNRGSTPRPPGDSAPLCVCAAFRLRMCARKWKASFSQCHVAAVLQPTSAFRWREDYFMYRTCIQQLFFFFVVVPFNMIYGGWFKSSESSHSITYINKMNFWFLGEIRSRGWHDEGYKLKVNWTIESGEAGDMWTRLESWTRGAREEQSLEACWFGLFWSSC